MIQKIGPIYGNGTIYSPINIPVQPFASGDPSGITLHYTADNSLTRTINSLKAKNLAYHFIIEKNGDIFQTFSMANMAAHAGKALWGGKSPNRSHLAIALSSWGYLDENQKAWNGQDVVGVKRNGKYWDVATKHQEKSLFALLSNLIKMFEIEPDNICGHDECAIPLGRKSDPGSILSISMPEIRRKLNAQSMLIT